MSNEANAIKEFNFTWTALGLLGKSLCTNAWSAISELVANGFDAGAKNVYVLIDASNKRDSTIEIMDDGSGMDSNELDVYVNVEYDRREAAFAKNHVLPDSETMGRKGIGKLAALFLSSDYVLQTKSLAGMSTWHMLFDGGTDPNERPHLTSVANTFAKSAIPCWAQCPTGTLLVLRHVDLTGLGRRAFEGLSAALANQFLLSSMPDKNIYLQIHSYDTNDDDFKPVRKAVAFKNMEYIAINYDNSGDVPEEIATMGNTESFVMVPNAKDASKPHKLSVEIEQMGDLAAKGKTEFKIVGTHSVPAYQLNREMAVMRPDVKMSDDGRFAEIPYVLEGWLGIHATIKNEDAAKNDERFVKNQFYNPARIRLYVRNKLAEASIGEKLGVTHAFLNYIEGEVSFDILDDDILPDIATSSRQGFDELDARWDLLCRILRPIVRGLINKRGEITGGLKKDEDRADRFAEDEAKAAAMEGFREELASVPDLEEDQKAQVAALQASYLKGNPALRAKREYKVFISHQSADACITNFIYKLLRGRDAKKEEFFYTSADDGIERYRVKDALGNQIKRNITDEKTLISYFTSPNFKLSEYCLFEAGAGWATCEVGDYQLLSTTYEDIPEYLTNGKYEMRLDDGGAITALNRTTYGFLVLLLNEMIDHINKGRKIRSDPLIEKFAEPFFEDEVQMRKSGKKDADFMDEDIKEYWAAYVSCGATEYEAGLVDARERLSRSRQVEAEDLTGD